MITREEYELLKNYRDKGYKWIVSDMSENLFMFRLKPFKRAMIWDTTENPKSCSFIPCRGSVYSFSSITWEDEEPTSIADLINEYETHQIITGEKVKVTVPQFVADWIEEVKALERSFKLEILFDTSEMPDEVFDWLDERYGDTDILAKAWMDGYEIEKEKLYTIRLANGSCLYRYVSVGIDWVKGPSDYRDNKDFHLTRAEIESVDPRLMQFAEEVE